MMFEKRQNKWRIYGFNEASYERKNIIRECLHDYSHDTWEFEYNYLAIKSDDLFEDILNALFGDISEVEWE